jgi:hypothetical protein
MGVIATARFWRAVSTALFVCFLASLAFEGFSGVPGWGWLVLIASGVTFAIELAFVATERRRTGAA